jgi:hypothetical protein
MKWLFDHNQIGVLNSGLIDTTNQFSKIDVPFKNGYLLYDIRYDLSVETPIVTTSSSKHPVKFNFFNHYDDMFARLSNVKISSLVHANFVNELRSIGLNYDKYDKVLFKSCLFQLFPIYRCFGMAREDLFRQREVKLTHFDELQHIELPNSLVEEVMLVRALENFDSFECVPLAADKFWTCFVFSLYTNISQDYAYKYFINKWHLEKGIPMPDLCIKKIDSSTAQRLILFVHHFLNTFYNNAFHSQHFKAIKACWSSKINDCKRQVDIVNNVITVKHQKSVRTATIRIFPGLLCRDKMEYCLYFQSNVDFKILFTHGTQTTSVFLKKDDFKHVISLVDKITNITIENQNNSLVYHGSLLTKNRTFTVKYDEKKIDQVFYVIDVSQEVCYGFPSCQCKTELFRMTRLASNRLVGIHTNNFTLNPKVYCSYKQLNLNKCFHDIFALETYEFDQLTKKNQNNVESFELKVTIGTRTNKRLIDLWSEVAELKRIEYPVKYFTFLNVPAEIDKYQKYYTQLFLTGFSNTMYLPDAMYKNIEPSCHHTIDSFDVFFEFTEKNFLPMNQSPQNINNWLVITSIPGLVFNYYLNIQFVNLGKFQLDFGFNFKKKSKFCLNFVRNVGQVYVLWYKNNVISNDIGTHDFDDNISLRMEFDVTQNKYYIINNLNEVSTVEGVGGGSGSTTNEIYALVRLSKSVNKQIGVVFVKLATFKSNV